MCTRLLGRARFKSWSVKKNSVPYMTEVVLTNVLVQGWIVYPYEDGFLDGAGLPLVLPAYDIEAGACNVVSCLLHVCMDGRGLLEVLLASFTKCPCCFSYVLLIAGYVVALETVDNPTLLFFRVLVFWLHEDLFYWYVVLKCSCIPYLPHVCLKLSARPFVYGMTTYATVDLGLELAVVMLAP